MVDIETEAAERSLHGCYRLREERLWQEYGLEILTERPQARVEDRTHVRRFHDDNGTANHHGCCYTSMTVNDDHYSQHRNALYRILGM